MRALRRLLQVVALVGTLLVSVVAIALIVSQTPWFRDWLRRYIVREAKQYLNGELTIGGIGGNLFYGVHVSDIAVDVSGERVVAAKSLEVDYSVFELVSKGTVVNEIKIVEPVIRLERNGDGWNLANLVKKQEQEADRKGPGRPVTLQSIEVEDARILIDDQTQPDGYRLPRRIDDLDLKASYEYAPVHYSVVVDRATVRASSPQFALTELTGKIAVRDDNVYVDRLHVRTAESSVRVDGVIEDYLNTPVLKLTTAGKVSLPEIGRVVPAASGYALHPGFDIRATGPAEHLVLDLDVRSEAGTVRGQLTADVKAPDFAARGSVEAARLNLAPILKNPAQRSDITGRAELDVRVRSRPASAPFVDRLNGSFRFRGPSVTAAGYTAANVRASGTFDVGRMTLDAEAAAYGGTGSARGVIVLPAGSRQIGFDLRGRAEGVDLRNLPAGTGAPKLATNLSVAEYQISGSGRNISGAAQLNRSTIEGATVGDGTAATFTVAPDRITYTARGSVSGLNLPRIGKALDVAALQKPEYDGELNGDFDVEGALPRTTPARAARAKSRSERSTVAEMTIDATGTLRDSTILGGRLPQLAYEAHLANGTLAVSADGRFEGFNPATLANRQDLDGAVSGTVDMNVRVEDVTAPVTPDAIAADGRVTLESSTIGGLKIDSAHVQGTYAGEVADLARLQVSGPDITVDAGGRLALDETGASNVKYHVEATNLSELGRLAGQENLQGSATLDGTVTGNRRTLEIKGSLDGSNVGYGDNKALDLDSTYTVTLPQLAVKQAHVEADTSATFLKAGGLDISSLTAKTTYEGERLQFTTTVKEERRELSASGEVILHPDHQEIHLPQFAVRTQGVEWTSAPGSEAAIQYGQDRVEVENVRLVSGNQSLAADGTFPLKAGAADGELKVQATDIDLQQLERLLLMERGLAGSLSANATISGTAQAPVVNGRFEVSNGAFRNYKYESLTGDIKYGGAGIDLDARLQQSPTELITARGVVPMSLFRPSPGGHVAPTETDKLDLQVQSTALDLGIVQGFTSQVTNVTGTLEADVRLTGSGQDPHLEGFVDIRNGAFGVPAGGVSYSGLNTRIALEPDRLTLQKFAIVDEHGEPLNVSGELEVHARKVGAVNVRISSDNFEVIDNELGDVGIDSDIRITGELRRPRIQGSVRLEAARLEVDEILTLFYDPYSVEELPPVVSAERTVEGSGSAVEATTGALRKAETTAAPPGAEQPVEQDVPAPGGLFSRVDLDLRLVIPDNLVLRGDQLRPGGPTGASLGDMNITVGGEMQVVKPAEGQVLLLGSIQTVRGTYEFQGRRFELVRGGTVRFLGEPRPNPALDITATRVIPNTGVEARVQIKGTARAPQLMLTSNPPLEESDILALIVFNRPVNELGTGERASLAATAGGIATGFLAAPLGESIGRALDLDLFEITTTTDQGDLGAGLTLGQQVGDRAFFKMRQQFGERSATEFQLEYQLSRFMRLQASAAPETTGSANRIGQRRIERAGIDLIFFFSY